MTATATPTPPTPSPTSIPPRVRWHRPLLAFGAVMVVLAVVCLVGYVIDPRELVGVNVWEKPLKFALSSVLYSVTWAWLIGLLQRGRRIAWWVGTVTVVLLAVELAIIVGAAIAGTTSHFNVSTPLATTLWSIMAFSISVIWAGAFVVSILLFRNRLGDAARSLAIRAGAIIALVGMGLAFLMTGPNAEQLSNFQGIAGAHTVGIPDGGPGLPILGWSTVAGDLRIPHFVGMHALQALPILVIVLELLARRVTLLREVTVRVRLVAVATVTYAASLALLTVQALRGQSIVQPDAVTLTIAGVIAAASLVGVIASLVRPRSRALAVD